MNCIDELWQAYEQLQQAERAGDPDAVARARELLKCNKSICAQIGTMLVILALEDCSFELQRKLGTIFGGLASSAFDRAKRAEESVKTLYEKFDAMKCYIKTLEKRIDDLTPSVGPRSR